MQKIPVTALFPTFTQQYLRSFSICACFELSDTPLSRIIEGQADDVKKLDDVRFKPKKGSALMRIRHGRFQPPGEKKLWGRFHVDCRIEGSPSQATATPGSSDTAKTVRKLLPMLFGQKVKVTCCEGVFLIPETKMPPRGFVGLLLGASASVGKAKMNLTGATFSVEERSPYRTLKWSRKPAPGKHGIDQIEVVICAYPSASDIAEGPENVANILSDGVRELVTEAGE